MGISVYQAQSQQSRLNGMATDIRNVGSGLSLLEHQLNQYYRSSETATLQIVIQQIARELGALAYDLERIGDDIVDAAEDIKREEEARARAAAAAAARAAAARAAAASQQMR